MTPENFCYWLQGLLEIGNPKNLDENQINTIKDHLRLVFKKETPHYSLTDFFKQAKKEDISPGQIDEKSILNITC